MEENEQPVNIETPVIDETDVDTLFNQAEEEEDGVNDVFVPTPEEAKDIQPTFGTEAWNDYVLRQFSDSELINGAPTCDGCRRVLEQLVGPIICSHINSYQAPNRDNNGTATVVVGVEVYVNNESHPAYGRTVVVEEIADVNEINTDAPYSKYPSATAATRAEGRALRKLLRLHNVVTAEEVSKVAEEDTDTSWEPAEPISDAQIALIDMLCGEGRLNLSVMQFVNSGRRIYTNIREVNSTTAQRMIQELNKIQQQKKEKPVGVGPYVFGWKSQLNTTSKKEGI